MGIVPKPFKDWLEHLPQPADDISSCLVGIRKGKVFEGKKPCVIGVFQSPDDGSDLQVAVADRFSIGVDQVHVTEVFPRSTE